MSGLNYYSTWIRNINILNYTINIIGLIGNILAFVVFSRKAFSKNSIGVYFRSLAVFDSFVVFNCTLGIISLALNTDVFNLNDWACKVVYTVSFMTSPMPGWVLVAFSLDQLVLVSKTKRFSFIHKRSFQYTVIACIVIFYIAIYSSTPLYVSSRNTTTQNITVKVCLFDFSSILPAVYLFESSIVPFAIMMVTTISTCKLLFDSRRNLERMININTKPNSNGVSCGVSSLLNSSRKSRDYRFAINSIILNVLFIVFETPLVMIYIFPFADYYENEFYKMICFSFFYLNFALHFLWTCASIHFFVKNS